MSRNLGWVLAVSALQLGALNACGGTSVELETAERELPPADPRAVRAFNAGNRLMARGRDRRARSQYEQAVEIDPNLWEAHYNIGVIDRRGGQLREAIARFETARGIQPGAREPLMAMVEAQYSMGERDNAGDLLRAFLEDVDPDAVQARVALAIILREEGDYSDALEQAREALIRDPSLVGALLEVGRIYRAQEQHDVAELVFRKALELSSEDVSRQASIRNELGLVALARGDTQAAFTEFAASIQADSAFTPARLNQGSVLLHAGDYAGAQVEYEAVLDIDEDDHDARVALGICLRGAGEHAQARRQYDRVLQSAPNHPAALFNLAVLRAEFLDRRPQSRELFQQFLEVAPSGLPQRQVAERYLQEIPAATGRGRRGGQ